MIFFSELDGNAMKYLIGVVLGLSGMQENLVFEGFFLNFIFIVCSHCD